MAIDKSREVTDTDRLKAAEQIIGELKSQQRHIRKNLLQAYGAASAFKMLDVQAADKGGEIAAAKETGQLIEKQLHDLLFAINDWSKDY